MDKEAFNNLLEIKKILYKMGLYFLIDGGTLLGFYRDGWFCKDDHDDIDLTIIGNDDKATIQELADLASEKGFEVYHFWEAKHDRTAQISFKKNGLKIDIMFKKKKGNKIWWTVYGGPNKITYKSAPAKHFLNTNELLIRTDLIDVEFSIPFKVEEYLEYRYGDWKIPVHRSEYSCFTSDKAITEYEKL